MTEDFPRWLRRGGVWKVYDRPEDVPPRDHPADISPPNHDGAGKPGGSKPRRGRSPKTEG